jgi:hypothetical protein
MKTVTVMDRVVLKIVIEVPGVAEKGTECAEQGELTDGFNLRNYGGLGHGQNAKV